MKNVKIDFDYKNIKNDVNGNPRVVIHFLAFADDYADAKVIANKLGGRVYRGKDFGGGFVFQCYEIKYLAKRIQEERQAYETA